MLATILYLVALLLSTSRGLLELEVGKSAAYLAQVGGIVALLVWYISPSALSAHFQREGRRALLLGAGLAVAIVVSILMTIAETGEFGASYIFLFIFTAFAYLYSVSNYRRRFVRPGLAYAGVILIALGQGAVAVFQQRGSFPIDLPGTTYGFDDLRVPALTGSYLHYPIFMAIASSLCAVDYLARRRISSALMAVALAFFVYVALSRSGVLIVVGTILLAAVKEPIRFVVRHGKWIVAALLATTVIAVSGGPKGDDALSAGADRIAGAFSLSSDGNDIRAAAWDKAIDLARPVNLVAGTYFGLVTNAATDADKDRYGVVESSLLQQILNIGLLGTVAYYGLLISLTGLLRERGRPIALCIYAALFQTLFYQSVEVIPFVFVFMTLPVFDVDEGGDRRSPFIVQSRGKGYQKFPSPGAN
jgi:hypothetical protein